MFLLVGCQVCANVCPWYAGVDKAPLCATNVCMLLYARYTIISYKEDDDCSLTGTWRAAWAMFCLTVWRRARSAPSSPASVRVSRNTVVHLLFREQPCAQLCEVQNAPEQYQQALRSALHLPRAMLQASATNAAPLHTAYFCKTTRLPSRHIDFDKEGEKIYKESTCHHQRHFHCTITTCL